MGLLLRGARVFTTADRPLQDVDVALRDGVVAALGKGLSAADGDRTIDCSGLVIAPGLVDLWGRLGEPGYEFREDLATGTRAAAAGGYTAVCAAPDSKPINDTRAVTELILRRAREVAKVEVWPLAALTVGLAGDSLAELGELAEVGAVAASPAEAWVSHGGLMRRALEYAATFDLPVMVKPVDGGIAAGGIAHEGPLSTRLGLPAVPVQAETAALARDLELAELTGAQLIVTHLSSARGVELVRAAKDRGALVMAAVSGLQLALDESAIADYDPAARLWPPLRSAADRRALIDGLADGTIDCVISDHDPKAVVDKEHEFADAEPGAIGYETTLSVLLQLVRDEHVSLERALDAVSLAPLRALGRDPAGLAQGAPASLCVFDQSAEWTPSRKTLHSKSVSTPLLGQPLLGQVVLTVAGGEVVHDPRGLHGR